MQIHEKIRTLFATLDNKEQKKVLRELTKTNNMRDADIKKVLVKCCPFCSSVQFSKNGHQGSVQRYKCKECQRVFTGKTGTARTYYQRAWRSYPQQCRVECKGFHIVKPEKHGSQKGNRKGSYQTHP